MMKKLLIYIMALCMVLSLCACAKDINGPTAIQTGSVSQSGTEPIDHTHDLRAEADNIVEHERMGYCGNTITTVTYNPRVCDCIGWERTFDGNFSVELTDFLRFLDYSDDICRCMPEYTIDTEFGTGYGLNLDSGYARHDGKQVDLTEEQVIRLREIMEKIHAPAAKQAGIALRIPKAVKIKLQSGNTGTAVEITDKDDIAHITDNLNDQRYNKGERCESDGWSYSLEWYDTNGKLLYSLVIMDPNKIVYEGYFYNKAEINSEIDTAFLDSMLMCHGVSKQ